MLAVDTNVVVRYLVGDHPEQSDKARKLFQDTAVWISATVLLEAAWVLRKSYRYRPDQIAWGFRLMAGRSTVTLQQPEALSRALDWVGLMDFEDALHLAQCGEVDAFVTFDRDFVRAAADVESVPVRLL